MYYLAAILLIGVSAMHSFVGGKRLIDPICSLPDLPIILGSRRNAELTLKFGWHFLSLFWLLLAGYLIALQLAVSDFEKVFTAALGCIFLLCGLIAVIASRGRHLSWVFFLPLSTILIVATLP